MLQMVQCVIFTNKSHASNILKGKSPAEMTGILIWTDMQKVTALMPAGLPGILTFIDLFRPLQPTPCTPIHYQFYQEVCVQRRAYKWIILSSIWFIMHNSHLRYFLHTESFLSVKQLTILHTSTFSFQGPSHLCSEYLILRSILA